MDRKYIKIYKIGDREDCDFVDLPSSECISLVWELTKEVYGLSGEYDVESRLQRNVVNIIRKQD